MFLFHFCSQQVLLLLVLVQMAMPLSSKLQFKYILDTNLHNLRNIMIVSVTFVPNLTYGA